jgi:predicted nucleic acid-binding protein
MTSWLVDTNVWLALAYDRHQHHVIARQWFEEAGSDRFYFCRLTQFGFCGLSSTPP